MNGGHSREVNNTSPAKYGYVLIMTPPGTSCGSLCTIQEDEKKKPREITVDSSRSTVGRLNLLVLADTGTGKTSSLPVHFNMFVRVPTGTCRYGRYRYVPVQTVQL
jgi:hypothetical protein